MGIIVNGVDLQKEIEELNEKLKKLDEFCAILNSKIYLLSHILRVSIDTHVKTERDKDGNSRVEMYYLDGLGQTDEISKLRSDVSALMNGRSKF